MYVVLDYPVVEQRSSMKTGWGQVAAGEEPGESSGWVSSKYCARDPLGFARGRLFGR